MIQNLNRLSFQDHGVILPTVPEQSGWAMPWEEWSLTVGTFPSFRAVAPTYITCDRGMTVLSVLEDTGLWKDLYLDKAVMLNPGVRFCVSAFHDTAVIRIASAARPEAIEARPHSGSLYICPNLRIRKLMTMFYQEKEPGFLFSGESHPIAELTYVDHGSLHSVVDGQDLLLEQGDLVIYGPGQWHVQYADMSVAPRFLTISFDAGNYDFSGLLNRRFRSPQKAIALLQKILREQEHPDEFSADMMITQLSLVLLQLQRETDTSESSLQGAHGLSNENEIIRRAQQYISTNVRKRLSVPLVAEKTDVSASYLTALFHKHLQISPGEYIRRIKLQESKQMIREGSMNFTEIAQALQYSTIHHFSRQFKEKFGITPTQYAKSIR